MRCKLFTGLVALCGFVLVSGSAGAADAGEAAPDALLSAATVRVTESLRQDGAARAPEKLAELIESTLLPLFDFNHMTRLAMARNWRAATAEQQADLVAEFRTLLVRTYSSALSSYRDQTIAYRPLRIAPGETDVTVRSTVSQSGPERLTVDYSMQKTPAGWKVYDVKIGGVSLVTTYQTTFAEQVRESGVEGLIKSLAARNRRIGAALAPPQNSVETLVLLHALVVPALVRRGP